MLNVDVSHFFLFFQVFFMIIDKNYFEVRSFV